jgi:hypothetical protein
VNDAGSILTWRGYFAWSEGDYPAGQFVTAPQGARTYAEAEAACQELIDKWNGVYKSTSHHKLIRLRPTLDELIEAFEVKTPKDAP